MVEKYFINSSLVARGADIEHISVGSGVPLGAFVLDNILWSGWDLENFESVHMLMYRSSQIF